MKRGFTSRILPAGLWTVLAIGAGPVAGDFCAEFARIVDASDRGFQVLRGEQISSHIDPISDTRVVWRCLQALPGADRCEIEWLRQTYTFHTLWLMHRSDAQDAQDAQEETFNAVRALLQGCGAVEKGSSKSGKSLWYRVGNRESLDIVLAYNINRVRLSISVVGFPNPGLE